MRHPDLIQLFKKQVQPCFSLLLVACSFAVHCKLQWTAVYPLLISLSLPNTCFSLTSLFNTVRFSCVTTGLIVSCKLLVSCTPPSLKWSWIQQCHHNQQGDPKLMKIRQLRKLSISACVSECLRRWVSQNKENVVHLPCPWICDLECAQTSKAMMAVSCCVCVSCVAHWQTEGCCEVQILLPSTGEWWNNS